MTYLKEQTPTQYTRLLAEDDFVALAYDRCYGGEARAWENPLHTVEGISAVVRNLASHPDVDATRIFTLGTCQGSSEAFRAAAETGDDIRGLATIAWHYRDHEGDIEWLTEEGYAARKAQALAEQQSLKAMGEVD